MLSSYPSELLDDYVRRNGWEYRVFEKQLRASNNRNATKTEALTMNYKVGWETMKLF